jgi:hypothetical protein
MKAGYPLLLLLVLAIAGAAYAGTGFHTLLREDFESVSPPGMPGGWVVLNADGDLGFWETRTYGGVTWGPQCIRRATDPTNPMAADDWFFTDGLALQPGVNYGVRFMYRVSSAATPEAMSIWVGNGQNPGSMSTLLWDDPAIFNEQYVEGGSSFTVPSSGTYYLGFHCSSPPYSHRLFLDDIEIGEEPYDELELRLVMARTLEEIPLVYATDDDFSAVVYVKNTGPSAQTINRRFAVGRWPSEVEIEFEIMDPFGQRLPCITMFDKMGALRQEDFIVLQPDSSVGKVVNLYEWHRFETLGDYTITARYRNYSDPFGLGAWTGELVSDPVVITVE